MISLVKSSGSDSRSTALPLRLWTVVLPVGFLLLWSASVVAWSSPSTPAVNRKEWLLHGSHRAAVAFGLAVSATSPLATPAIAATTTSVVNPKLQTYTDSVHGFSIAIPSTWTFSEETLADRRKILLWTDPTDSAATSLFIAFTPVRDDFTSLGSFGSVDQVAAQTILPKSNLMDETSQTSATMLSAISTKQAYLFDYTQQVGGVQNQPLTHFRSIFSLVQGATGGAGAVLVTITAQTPESRYAAVQSTLDSIVNSYGKIVA